MDINVVTLDVQLAKTLEKLKPGTQKYVQDQISALLDVDNSIREHLSSMRRSIAHNLTYTNSVWSGSAVEGAMMARCFQKNEDWKEIEIDLMYNEFTILQELSHLLEPVEDKPGFLRIPCCQKLCSDFYTIYAKTIIGGIEHDNLPYSLPDPMPQYISPHLMKNYVKGIHEFFGPNIIVGSKIETTWEVKYPELQTKDGRIVSISTDFVPAVRLLFWPHQTAAWITRHRRWWPQQDTIQSIAVKGCQVVPRSSPGGDINSEWRLSFSGPEEILAQLRNRGQQQAYYFFKMFFYRYLKCVESSETEGKCLYSYIIKTTMLWAYEDLPPEDPMWASLENSVEMLLFKLLGSLETGFLAHYFIPEINLLEKVGGDVRTKCVTIIRRWQNDMLMSAPFDMPEKLEHINSIHTSFAEAYTADNLNKMFSEHLNEMMRAKLNKHRSSCTRSGTCGILLDSNRIWV